MILEQHNTLFHDIEVYPNFFSLLAKPLGSDEWKTYIKMDGGRDDIPELLSMLHSEQPLMVAFNNYVYDDRILKLINKYPKINNWRIYQFSKKLIESRDGLFRDKFNPRQLEMLRDVFWYEPFYPALDLYQLLKRGPAGFPLKMAGIHLRMPTVRDLPIHPDEMILRDQIDDLITYNKNDVLTTEALAMHPDVQKVIKTRFMIQSAYGVPALTNSESKLGQKIIKELWRPYGRHATFRDEIHIGELLSDKIQFKSPEFKHVRQSLASTNLEANEQHRFPPIDYKITYRGLTYSLKKGGIHSVDGPAVFRSDDDFIMIDCDITSMYPAIMINEGIKPEHIDDTFLPVYEQIRDDRVKAKREGDIATASALKIVVNSLYGLMGNQYQGFYDPAALYAVTTNGQLFLLMLAEMLSDIVQPISANTDGILSMVPRDRVGDYYAVCKEWEQLTGLQLEYEEFKLYVRSAVNDYFAIPYNGKAKSKGEFKIDRGFHQKYIPPVVTRGIREYFINGTTPEDTVNETNDIHDFIYSFKVTNKYNAVLQLSDGSEIPMQKTNRLVVVTDGGGQVMKVHTKVDGRNSRFMSGKMVTVANDITDKTDLPIDKNYYIREIKRMIKKVDKEWTPDEPQPIQDFEIDPAAIWTPDRFFNLEQFINSTSNLTYKGGGKYQGKCPGHDGIGDTSLVVTVADGELMWYCFAGCTRKDLLGVVK